ncbi:MAG: CZB domain-containing protein [Hyphomicrobiaceae bacterium]|nr:CZB domain-containing protein [Hyphomicrobiaceae bacterium]
MSNSDGTLSINNAICAHSMWKLRLYSAISSGKTDADVETVKCDNKCEFGKWLYGSEIDPATKKGASYEGIRHLHAEFHKCAAEVLGHAVGGKKEDALFMFGGEFSKRSNTLVRALTNWKHELAPNDANWAGFQSLLKAL